MEHGPFIDGLPGFTYKKWAIFDVVIPSQFLFLYPSESRVHMSSENGEI
jgi:hypothetical protein